MPDIKHNVQVGDTVEWESIRFGRKFINTVTRVDSSCFTCNLVQEDWPDYSVDLFKVVRIVSKKNGSNPNYRAFLEIQNSYGAI